MNTEQQEIKPIEQIEKDDEKIQAPKKKKVVSEKTKEALAKGREKLKEKWTEDQKRRQELNEKYAIKKANKMIKEKLNIKKSLGVEDLDSEEEEPIKLIQPKKPRKKQIIMMDPESESEEEVIYKKAPQKSVKQPKQENLVIEEKPKPRIIFF